MKTLSAGSRTRDKCVKMPPAVSYTPKRSAKSRGSKRTKPRVLMRAWLENLLDTGLCRGLQWVDEPSRVFSIVWRHGSSSSFNPSEHSEVFYRWAEHTGKVKKGSGLDHSQNKSTFRCAIHSLPDCIEHTQDGDKKGTSAKRTFQFIEPGHPEYDCKKRAKGAKKIEIQPKEESLACTSDTNGPDSWTLDIVDRVTDQETSTWDSKHSLWRLELVQSVEVPDLEQITSTWLDFPEEAGTSTFIDHPSSTLAVEQTAEFGGHSLVSQKTVRNATSPTAGSAVVDVVPPGAGSAVIDAMPFGVVEASSPASTNHETEAVDNSKLPVFAKLGLSDTDTCEALICNTWLSSGGNVKINKCQLNRSSPLEFVNQQSLLQQRDDTAVAPVGPDYASTDDTDYGDIGPDFMDCFGGMDVSNTAENGTHNNMALDGYLPEQHYSPLAEENSFELLSNFILGDINENLFD